ncbi:MAG: hypothetical protein JNK26_00770 [Candidatus Doudnabacteria bacterium]|nr:hypothetical protein [Candidatus Doudnabacteria bacterium]
MTGSIQNNIQKANSQVELKQAMDQLRKDLNVLEVEYPELMDLITSIMNELNVRYEAHLMTAGTDRVNLAQEIATAIHKAAQDLPAYDANITIYHSDKFARNVFRLILLLVSVPTVLGLGLPFSEGAMKMGLAALSVSPMIWEAVLQRIDIRWGHLKHSRERQLIGIALRLLEEKGGEDVTEKIKKLYESTEVPNAQLYTNTGTEKSPQEKAAEVSQYIYPIMTLVLALYLFHSLNSNDTDYDEILAAGVVLGNLCMVALTVVSRHLNYPPIIQLPASMFDSGGNKKKNAPPNNYNDGEFDMSHLQGNSDRAKTTLEELLDYTDKPKNQEES